jgi:hypothetical protein
MEIELSCGFFFAIANKTATKFVGFSKSYREYVWDSDVQSARQFQTAQEAEEFVGRHNGFKEGCIVRIDLRHVYTITTTK